MSANAKPATFARLLIDWQQHQGRHHLPWQGSHRDAYRVWLSEIMLQQTQVQTVIPYFQRFLARFPNLSALANASEQEVLALWSGLGYYQRGRNLLACAKQVHGRYGGKFPDTAQALAGLPGVGPSTAAAIAAIVYKERVAILDGNVKRVLSRVTCADAPWGSPALERLLWREAQLRLPDEANEMPVYTQAIMDLGAMICRAKAPLCDACPVRAHCAAHAAGVVSVYPKPKVKRLVPTKKAHWAVLCNSKTVWLAQQATQGIWPGLWVPWQLDLEAMPMNWKQTVAGLQQVIDIKHAFSHYKLEISAGIIQWPVSDGFVQSVRNALPDSRRDHPPVGAPKNLTCFGWHEALALPLPAPVRTLLLRLCPSETASDDESRRNSRTKNVA